MKKVLITTAICWAGLAQLFAQDGDVNQFKWLAGNWSGTDGNGNFSEFWKIENPNLLTAFGCYVVGQDTVVKEWLRIEKIGNFWTYIPVIGDQQPVLFTLISATNNTWTFENKEHDFPQRICYSKLPDGSLKAWIEGMKDGKEMMEEYPMKKVR